MFRSEIVMCTAPHHRTTRQHPAQYAKDTGHVKYTRDGRRG